MSTAQTVRKRGPLVLLAGGLLLIAIFRIPQAPAWQGAVPMSKPGEEDITFWANHNGLEQLDIIGEAGFGDMARILMRRRSNAPLMRALRDRFTFKIQQMSALHTPDVFRLTLTDSGLTWANRPERFVIGASQTFNLSLIIENSSGSSTQIAADFKGTTARSEFHGAELATHATGGYFLRVVESEPGQRKGVLTIHAGARDLITEIALDVRPLVRLQVIPVDENGRPSAARVYLTGSSGLAYAPAGSISRFAAMAAENFFHIDGPFAVDVPAGETLIETTRGPEYELTSRTVNATRGMAPVRVQLKRWVDMASKGWYSADAHIHANYTAEHHQTIDVHDVRLYAHAEDLNNANMMVANSSAAFLHDIQYFDGKPNALSDDRFVLYWNEEMRNRGTYGHMAFFNLKKLVYPLYTGFTDTPYPEDYPPNDAQAEAAQKQNAAVTYVHPAMVPTFEGMSGANARELPVDLALNHVDAMDVVSNNDEIASMEIWYRLLNCGFRLAISAGTDSFTNVADHYTPGGGRVYVHSAPSGSPLRYEDWVRAYKQGRSFASNGPVIFFTVNGKEPGDELHFAANSKQKVRVKATLRTDIPVDRFEIVVNGEVAVSHPTKNEKIFEIDQDLPLDGSAWVAARAIGPWSRMVLNDLQTFAHTSPVYVRFGGKPTRLLGDLKFYDEWIDKMIAHTKERGRFTNPAHREEVLALFRRAQEVYRRYEAEAATVRTSSR